jgi:spectinomycin phosphotransferase
VRRSGDLGAASLAVPFHLHSRGVPRLLAPLPTAEGALWAPAGDYALSLYPFIDGRQAVAGGLSATQWQALGATVRRFHHDPLTPELRALVRRETFVPSRRELLPMLEASIERPDPADEVQGELAAFWRGRREMIRTAVARADALGRRLRERGGEHVLCHADLHTWNVLLDAAGGLWLVDWDEVVLAPRERDLMFVIGGIGPGLVRPGDTAAFFQGYGETAVDPLALSYYRYAWAVQDIAAYAERVFDVAEYGPETRREAVVGFARLFAPGEIVELALAGEGAGG